MIKLGSKLTLPSGRMARVTAPFDERRPWYAIKVKDAWQVCRTHGQLGARGGTYYFGGSSSPMQLEEVDARSLAEQLNRVSPGRYPGA